MKRLALVSACISAALALALAGCAASPSANIDPNPSESVFSQEPIPEDTPVATSPEDVLGAPTSGTFTLESNGYVQTAYVTLYPGVNGRDAELLRNGWQSVGGTGDNPCLSTDIPNDMWIGLAITPENAYYVFGTIAFSEEANGFTPIDLTWQFTGGGRNSDGSYWSRSITPVMGVGYSSGAKCDGLASGGFMSTPTMNGGTNWGPAPMVIGLAGVYTPEHPQGQVDVTQFSLDAGITGDGELALPGLSAHNSVG